MTPFQKTIKYLAVAFAFFLIVSIFAGIFSAIGSIAGLSNDAPLKEMKSFAITGQIENLDLEIGAAELKIVSGDQFRVDSNHKHLRVEEKNGTLKIYEEKVVVGTASQSIMVMLTVPEGFSFREASVETGAGKVDIAALSADKLSLDLGAGATEIGTLNARNRCRIATGAGKLTIQDGQFRNLEASIGVGKLELTGSILGQSIIDFGIGGGDITLTGSKEDYQIHLDKGIGDATLDGMVLGDGSVYGTGSNCIDIDSGIGSINIQFQ